MRGFFCINTFVMINEGLPNFAEFFSMTAGKPHSPKEEKRPFEKPNWEDSRIGKGFTGMQRMRQNLVPDKDRAHPELNDKVEALRDAMHGKKVLNAKDLQYIVTTYKIRNLTPDSPREIGTTGITIGFDEGLGSYCLTK